MNRENENQSPVDEGAEQAALNGNGQFDEARLTAYVLGELAGEEHAAEREAVERELAASENTRSIVAEIRRSVELMTAALATEAAGALTPAGREKVESRIEHIRPAPAILPLVRRTRSRYRFAIVAASLLLGVSGWLLWPTMQAARELRRSVAAKRFENANADQASSVVSEASQQGYLEYARGRDKSKFDLTEQMGDVPLHTSVQPGIPAEKNPQRVPYTINKPVYETKSRDIAFATGKSIYKNAPKTPAPTVEQVPARLRESGREHLLAGRNPKRRGEVADSDHDGIVDAEWVDVSGEGFNTEAYSRIVENSFLDVRQNPLSTFSIDVDTAAYANVRRFLTQQALPPKDAVRIEELVNYFKYDYAPPADGAPFAVHAEIAGCPWAPEHRLLRVALKGREIDFNSRPASNLVFLIDVSGSMDQPNKLPLLKAALRLLVDRLSENDRIAMVVYAGSSGLVLPSTTGDRQAVIAGALEQLQAGGSTNGASGIQLAYETARQNFIRGGVNRVILCTDGDFNVGITDEGALTRLIESEAKSGVFLSVLGFGAGNLKDATMEKLADRGNGNYGYIDNLNEARKVLVEQAGGTLVTIAKDVKLQLEFNPSKVATYRLVGYENRMLRNEDFNDDAKDAGEIGAGHTVTAFYELVPAGGESPVAAADPLKYQKTVEPAEAAASDEVLTLKLRYKEPDGAESKLIESVVKDSGRSFAQAGGDFQFAASVAAFGLVLRDSQFKSDLTLAAVLELAAASRGADEEGYRAEFIELVKQAQALDK